MVGRPGDSKTASTSTSTVNHGKISTLRRQEVDSAGEAVGPVRYCLRGVYAVSRAAIGRLVSTVYGGQRRETRVVVSTSNSLENRSNRRHVAAGSSFVLPVVKFSTMQVSFSVSYRKTF